MAIAGSCELLLVFSPEDRVRKVLVRVADGLPYGLIIKTAFLKKHGSIVSFAPGGGAVLQCGDDLVVVCARPSLYIYIRLGWRRLATTPSNTPYCVS